MDIRKIQKIEKLIRYKQTGTPKILAEKLGCSERTVFKYIKFMKEDLEAPIRYNEYCHSYVFKESGDLCIHGFKKKILSNDSLPI